MLGNIFFPLNTFCLQEFLLQSDTYVTIHSEILTGFQIYNDKIYVKYLENQLSKPKETGT